MMRRVDVEFQSTLPARGATSGVSVGVVQNVAFQSTLPARGATGLCKIKAPDRKFQSTLPARGATWFNPTMEQSESISIHAPRTGSDGHCRPSSCPSSYFNPRSPHGERRARSRRAADLLQHFNPRSPHGERRCRSWHKPAQRRFQSTLPARGATRSTPAIRRPVIFQSTLPARGATRRSQQRTGKPGFQSTLPARGATPDFRRCGGSEEDFNPRSPHGERLVGTHRLTARKAHFNPRSPHGERLTDYSYMGVNVAISIHAPRTGSDFSSRVPRPYHADFNPRSPHGERQTDSL